MLALLTSCNLPASLLYWREAGGFTCSAGANAAGMPLLPPKKLLCMKLLPPYVEASRAWQSPGLACLIVTAKQACAGSLLRKSLPLYLPSYIKSGMKWRRLPSSVAKRSSVTSLLPMVALRAEAEADYLSPSQPVPSFSLLPAPNCV